MRFLQTHYHAPDKTLTATQMAKAMGYYSFKGANLHYGKLGKIVGKALDWDTATEKEAQGAPGIFVLSEFKKPGKEWFWIMRPEVAQALETLRWTNDAQAIIPEEIEKTMQFYEGSVRAISVNTYERNTVARKKCILHHGCKCAACGIILADIYGNKAQGYIHVHHLRQLSEINAKYQVDPIQDLRPVCPNCHAIIHMNNPPYTIDEIKDFMVKQRRRI